MELEGCYIMYAVGVYNAPDTPAHYIFPNIFTDLDMAVDCVIYQIKKDHGAELNSLDLSDQLGGVITVHFEETVYTICKIFNFKE